MKNDIITYKDPKSPISEIFRTLRTNLQFMTQRRNEAMSLLVTSTMPGEGKSMVSSNLAVAFAQSNKKVILIDSDMRKGRLHNIFKTKIFPGLSNYLADANSEIFDYIIRTEIENLYIIPAGNVPPNPSELLSNERMLEGLEDLKKEFDVIIYDSTPCMLVTDAMIISRIVDNTVIVTSYKTTKIENLKEVKRNIENVGGKIAGVIINKVSVSLKKYNEKYYYYGDKNNINNINNIKKNTTNTVKKVSKDERQEWIDTQEEARKENNIGNTQPDEEILNQVKEYLEKNKR